MILWKSDRTTNQAQLKIYGVVECPDGSRSRDLDFEGLNDVVP